MNLSFDIWDEASSNILTLSLNVASQKDFPQSWLSFLFCFIFLFEYAQIQLLGNPSPLFSPLHFFPFSLSFSQLLLLFGGGLIAKSCPTLAIPRSLSMGFSNQVYWSGLSCPSPGDFPLLLFIDFIFY